MTKHCPRCHEDKPLDARYWNKARSLPGGFGGYCKLCNREYMTLARRKKSALKVRCPSCGAYFVPRGLSCCSASCRRAFDRHLADLATVERLMAPEPWCQCGAKLWGETDWLGRVGDWCPTCGYRRLIERRVPA